jgi:ABC-type phosphate transport system substrate-binding protein
MGPQADFYTSINQIVSTNALLTGLLASAISAGVALLIRIYHRRGEGRLSWGVTNDVQINQGDSGTAGSSQQPSQRRWKISYTHPDINAPGTEKSYPVHNGSLVIFELRNNGRHPILNTEFAESNGKPIFRADFPGRKVMNFKVRGNDDYRALVERSEQNPREPGRDSYIMLPPPENFAPGKEIKLFVLLDDADPPPHEPPRISGELKTGGIVQHGQPPGRAQMVLIGAAALVVIAGIFVAGATAGASLNNHVVTPTAKCGEGTLTIEGSTAFAPIMTLVATEYEQQCPNAQITVTGNGSGQGLTELEHGDNPPGIAMYDGTPVPLPPSRIKPQAVGDLIMAVVGNGAPGSLPPSVFQQGPGQGLSSLAITQAFVQGGTDIPGLSGYDITTVGRPRNSGTREAFIQTVAGGNDMANGTVPTEGTTMDLLGYVDTTPRSIGYAEADALPFFQNAREIAIDTSGTGYGYLPTRANALNGTYKFLATEHLYTNGPPTGLAADLISFLTSSPEVAQLRDTSFIGCADLAGTALSADCADN